MVLRFSNGIGGKDLSTKKIDVSLSRGKLWNRAQSVVFYCGIVACCCFFVITVLLIAIPQVVWDIELILIMGSCDIGAVAFMSLLIVVKIQKEKLSKDVMLWLEDAIEIKAYSQKLGENRLGFQPKATKIRVSFNIGGKHFRKDSSLTPFGGWEGYAGCFNKYADREVNIMYSPKYDEVLILKD